MGKGGKYIAARKKRSGKMLMIIAAILILALTGLLFFLKKDGSDKQEVPAPTIQTIAPSQVPGIRSWSDQEIYFYYTAIHDLCDSTCNHHHICDQLQQL